MKAKIKKGDQILFSKKWDKITDYMIINFIWKNTYNSFKQVKNHLLIDTTKGEIDIVFTGEVPKLEFDGFWKDQLVLKVSYDANRLLEKSLKQDFEWVCNECNCSNLTSSVSEDEIEMELHSCINCGCFEMHKRHFQNVDKNDKI